jgi:hypothetical protein
MNRRLIYILLFIGILAAAPVSAERIRFKGNFVLAHWSQDDECTHAETQLIGGESVTKTKSDGTTVEEIRNLHLSVTKINFCTQSFDIFAFGGTDVGTFTVDATLASSSIVATIPVFDELTQSFINMSVNVTINATEDATIRKSRFRSRTPLGTSGTSSLSIQRSGSATGSVIAGETNYAYGTSDFSFLAFDKNGQFTSTR